VKRRTFLSKTVTTCAVMHVTTFTIPAQAFTPPAIVAIAGVFISVAFRRYVITPFMTLLARWFPRLFATETRKYLMAVAVAVGLNEAKAAVAAEKAESSGATDLARDGFERLTDIEVRNDTSEPLELARLHVLLVDVESRTVDLKSTVDWGIVVSPNSTMRRQVAATRFPSSGLKQWYVSDANRTLAVSKPFMVVV
jgi:hypothetical protein